MTRRTVTERFWEKVDRSGKCWMWTAAKSPLGYGKFSVGTRANGKMHLAHRVSWELKHGPIQDELCVLHKCDTPGCIRPSHLFLGTRADNNADMAAKGRQRTVRGSKNGLVSGKLRYPERFNIPRPPKLTEAQVMSIRELYAAGGATYAKLGTRFDVSLSMVWNIVSRKSWTHI